MAYARIDGKFRIHVVRRVRLREEDLDGTPCQRVVQEERIPWQSAGRDLKLTAHAALPDLLDEIVAVAETKAAVQEARSAEVRGILA